MTGAQVDHIVAAAGVARGTFYFHFPTKEDVVLEWERRRESEIVALLQTPPARRSLRAALVEIVRFVGGLETAPEEHRLVLETLAIRLLRGADPSKSPLLAEIEQRLALAAGRGEVRADRNPHQLAFLFLSNLLGFLVARADPRSTLPTPELLVDVFLSGVGMPRQARDVAHVRRAAGRTPGATPPRTRRR